VCSELLVLCAVSRDPVRGDNACELFNSSSANEYVVSVSEVDHVDDAVEVGISSYGVLAEYDELVESEDVCHGKIVATAEVAVNVEERIDDCLSKLTGGLAVVNELVLPSLVVEVFSIIIGLSVNIKLVVEAIYSLTLFINYGYSRSEACEPAGEAVVLCLVNRYEELCVERVRIDNLECKDYEILRSLNENVFLSVSCNLDLAGRNLNDGGLAIFVSVLFSLELLCSVVSLGEGLGYPFSFLIEELNGSGIILNGEVKTPNVCAVEGIKCYSYVDGGTKNVAISVGSENDLDTGLLSVYLLDIVHLLATRVTSVIGITLVCIVSSYANINPVVLVCVISISVSPVNLNNLSITTLYAIVIVITVGGASTINVNRVVEESMLRSYNLAAVEASTLSLAESLKSTAVSGDLVAVLVYVTILRGSGLVVVEILKVTDLTVVVIVRNFGAIFSFNNSGSDS